MIGVMRGVLLLVGGLVACSSNDAGFTARPGGAGTGGTITADGAAGASGATGCTRDVDCKGARVCERGVCVDPNASGGSSGKGGALGTGGRDATDASAAGSSNGGGGAGTGTGGGGAVPAGGSSGTGGAPATGGNGGSTGTGGAGGTTGTLCPLALFIMQDRSGSMVTGFPAPASAESWNNSTLAITTFVQDPETTGIDIGLGTFPVGANNTASCTDGSDCGTPVVPIAPLPGNGAAMIQAMQEQTPNPIATTPTECGLRGMINRCLAFMASSANGEKCVAVLVTDGSPTQCDMTLANLAQIVADGHAQGVTTFALGLPGADLNFLDSLATAGGTGSAIDVSGGAQAFVAALNSVRARSTSGQCN